MVHRRPREDAPALPLVLAQHPHVVQREDDIGTDHLGLTVHDIEAVLGHALRPDGDAVPVADARDLPVVGEDVWSWCPAAAIRLVICPVCVP